MKRNSGMTVIELLGVVVGVFIFWIIFYAATSQSRNAEKKADATLQVPATFVDANGKKIFQITSGDYGTVLVMFDKNGNFLQRIEPGAPQVVQQPVSGPQGKKP